MCQLFIIKRLLKLFKIHVPILNNQVPIINNRITKFANYKNLVTVVRLFNIKSLIIYNQQNDVILNNHDVILIIYNNVNIIYSVSHIINNHVIRIVLFINTLEL